MRAIKPIYDKNTLEFVTVTLEFCALLETTSDHTLFSFTDKAVKILPLLYLKATLLPETGEPAEEGGPEFSGGAGKPAYPDGLDEQTYPDTFDEQAYPDELDEPEYAEEVDEQLEHFITEQTYEVIRHRLALLLGEYDSYLETFHPDMEYSDAPIAATISENLADVYQDLGDFVALFRQENEAVMQKALAACETNFRYYWGQKLLNALKALHVVRFNENVSMDDTDFLTEEERE